MHPAAAQQVMITGVTCLSQRHAKAASMVSERYVSEKAFKDPGQVKTPATLNASS
jgi:hypothetical protein